MRVLNTVYLTEPGLRVTARRSSIEVRREGALVARFPLEGIDGLILGARCATSNELLARCCARGIRVAQLGYGGRLKFAVQGPTRGNVLLRVRQYELTQNRGNRLKIAQSFVAGKLQNQRRLVMRWSWDAPLSLRGLLVRERERIDEQIRSIQTARDGDHLRGIEGAAARSYFTAFGAILNQRLPDFTFLSRTRRPPLDPVNALLSYLSGLGVSEAIGALDAVGLDPQIGFLHDLRPGRPSLALDLVEEYRPVLDRFGLKLLTLKSLTKEHFLRLPTGAYRLTDDARKFLLTKYEEFRSEELFHPLLKRPIVRSNLVLIQSTLLARSIRGDLSLYPPFVMEP